LFFLGLLPLCRFIRFAIRFFVPQFFFSGDDKQNRKQRQKNNKIDMPNCGLSSTDLLLFRIFLVCKVHQVWLSFLRSTVLFPLEMTNKTGNGDKKTVKEIMLNRGISSTDKKTVREIIMLNRVGVRPRQTSD
jgi:hypothetical protein